METRQSAIMAHDTNWLMKQTAMRSAQPGTMPEIWIHEILRKLTAAGLRTRHGVLNGSESCI